MSNNTVASIYSGVIKDVIANVRKDFEDSGIDEAVLYELERIWENKIRSAKVAPWEANGLTGEDPNQNGSSSTNIYPHPQPPPSDPTGIKYPFEQPAAALVSRAVPSMHANHNNDIGGTQPFVMKNNKYTIQASPASLSTPITSNSSVAPINNQQVNVSPNISPVDQKIYHNQIMRGPPQDLNIGHLNEKLIPRDPREASSNSSPQPLPEFETQVTQVEPSFDNDDINSDLDDSEDDDNNADSEETQNIILCLYDKVTRTKNKWKCQLKDGIVSVNGRDYLFQKGNGDFEF